MDTIRPAGRNDPCPCGSGKKFKTCCAGHVETLEKERRSPWMWGGIAVVGVALTAFAAWNFGGTENVLAKDASPLQAPLVSLPGTPAPFTPQVIPPSGPSQPPPGEAPPGKVWSAEHGHYHDAPSASAQTPAGMNGALSTTATTSTNPAFTPEPAGPPPAGKVWSPEHGHYHDLPAPVTPGPQ